MKRLMVLGVIGLAALGADSVHAEDAPKSRKLTDAERKDIEKKMIATMNAHGRRIDGCTERYLAEYPAATGRVSLSLSVDGRGHVSKASAKTTLPGARNLRPCLEKVGAAFRFPVPEGFVPSSMTVPINVSKKAKFQLYAPGEAPAPKEKEDTGPMMWSYQPGSFGFL